MDDVHNEQKSVKERSSLLIVPIDVVFDHERNVSFLQSTNIFKRQHKQVFSLEKENYIISYSLIEELVNISLTEDF
jgi:hypothetical protein